MGLKLSRRLAAVIVVSVTVAATYHSIVQHNAPKLASNNFKRRSKKGLLSLSASNYNQCSVYARQYLGNIGERDSRRKIKDDPGEGCPKP
jgi:hypothetical protein